MNGSTLACKINGSILLVKSESIEWVEAARNSVKVHMGEEAFVLKTCLDELQEKLNTSTFIRIHRATIVNVEHIRELRPWLRGTYRVVLLNGTHLLLSRNYRSHFFEVLGKPLG